MAPVLRQELVGQGALAVVDVGDDGEIANEAGICAHAWGRFRNEKSTFDARDGFHGATASKGEYTDATHFWIEERHPGGGWPSPVFADAPI